MVLSVNTLGKLITVFSHITFIKDSSLVPLYFVVYKLFNHLMDGTTKDHI